MDRRKNRSLYKALFVLSILAATVSAADEAQQLPEHINNNTGPFHLSWHSADGQVRWDFVYDLDKNITANSDDLASLIGVTNSSIVAECLNQKACLFKESQLVQTYDTSLASHDASLLAFSSPVQTPSNDSSKSSQSEHCFVKIHNYCSTHLNPPIHVTGDKCRHTIHWHSPYSCSASQANYEIPCYVHDPSGKLIDLTHLVRSNGSGYEIDTGAFNETISKFYLNVCNVASKQCSPDATSCRTDNKGTIETGFNNLTSIKYDTKEESVHLISFGKTDNKCAEKRVKTVVKFRCPKQFLNQPKPKLVTADDCENIIDWPTVRACPVPDVKATQCGIKYDPLGINIDLKQVFVNQDLVEVPDIMIEGKNKTMILGLCKGIDPSKYRCAGKSSRATSACLTEKGGPAEKSEIVGLNTKSNIRLADSRLLIESSVTDKMCQIPVTPDFNYTRQVGTRIEVVCSLLDDLKPKFVGFEDCVYVFEWGSSQLCLENMISQPKISNQPSSNSSTNAKPTITPLPSSSPVPMTANQTENHDKLTPDAATKSAHDLHKDTVADAKEMLKPEGKDSQNNSSGQKAAPQVVKPEPKKDVNGPGKMNKVHKFFMIGLIVMSLTAFVVVIFVLDRKTNFKIPLGRIGRRARQAFRPQPVPYTRVSFNDNLDL